MIRRPLKIQSTDVVAIEGHMLRLRSVHLMGSNRRLNREELRMLMDAIACVETAFESADLVDDSGSSLAHNEEGC